MSQECLVYAALGDPTRLAMVERLARGECTVSELRRPFAISAPAVSKHLRALERAGLLERRRRGRHQLCRLRAQPLQDAGRWLEEQTTFWSASLDSLEAHLAGDDR